MYRLYFKIQGNYRLAKTGSYSQCHTLAMELHGSVEYVLTKKPLEL